MNGAADNTVRFRAITFGADCDSDAVTVGFEMDRRPGHDSRGLLVSRAAPEQDHGDGVCVEFGEPQQHCMYGGIEKVDSTPGHFRIQFTEAGAKQIAGIRAIEVDYEQDAKGVAELLAALDYIFKDFAGYKREPGALPKGDWPSVS